MLFDLRGGGRRRVVQVTYIMLAVLIGGGLVLFGIGGSVSGGLVDAITGSSGTSSGNAAYEKRVKQTVAETRARPKDPTAWSDLARARFQLASTTDNLDQAAGTWTASGKKELAAAAAAWTPTPQDAFTALVVMTPTMSEYFDAWKNSRFVAGDQANEKAFVAASRLQDIADILGGLETVYAGVQPRIAAVDQAQAEQTGRDLSALTDFAETLRDEEADGRRFDAEDAETLGTQAQDQAEAIAGQVSQAAGKLNIPLAES